MQKPTFRLMQFPYFLFNTVSHTKKQAPYQKKRKRQQNPLPYMYPLWQGQQDLNPRPAVLETAALPTELYP